MPQPQTADRVRIVTVGIAAVAQVVSSPLTTLALGPDANTGAVSDDLRSPLTPAGYAFAIWGLIYLSSLVLAVYQALPSQQARDVHRRTGWWLGAAFTASTIWVPIFGLRLIWLSQLVILGLVACLTVTLLALRRSGPAVSRAEQFALRLPVTMYLGWALPASAAGFGVTFRSSGMPAEAAWVSGVAIALIAAVTLAAATVVGQEIALAGFTFTVAWALIGVVVGTYVPVVAVAAVVAIAVTAALLVARTARSRRREEILLG